MDKLISRYGNTDLRTNSTISMPFFLLQVDSLHCICRMPQHYITLITEGTKVACHLLAHTYPSPNNVSPKENISSCKTTQSCVTLEYVGHCINKQ